jgi:hypothetical protein
LLQKWTYVLCKKINVKTEGTNTRQNSQLTNKLGKVYNYQNELCNFSCHKKFDNKPSTEIQIQLIFIDPLGLEESSKPTAEKMALTRLRSRNVAHSKKGQKNFKCAEKRIDGFLRPKIIQDTVLTGLLRQSSSM